MCIIIGKYFEELGWIGIKNRDRNYVPEISFKRIDNEGNEILYFWDNITQYCEGMNSYGISVLSASLMVRDDEKEISVRSSTPSKDGIKIKKSLEYTNIGDVVDSLIDQKLTGHTIIFDQDNMYILEGAWRKGQYKSQGFDHVLHKLNPNDTIVRTNHGIELTWAGYQHDNSKAHCMSRLSSENRKNYAELSVESSTSPFDILDNLTIDYTGDGQMNPTRTSTQYKKMRTTSQTLIIPKNKTLYVRPIQSKLEFDFWEMNDSIHQTWVEILSNRVLYQNLKGHDFHRSSDMK